MIEHCRILAAMRSKSADEMAWLISSRGGHPLAQRETGEQPMNATIRSETIEATEVDSNLAAVSEVEADIRDFVRNDIAYLRRPASGLPVTETALEPSAEATVNSVNSLIQRVAGTSLAEIEKLISELEGLRDLLHAEGQRVQREISGYAQLSQAAMKSTRMIADNVTQWKRAADGLRNS
jgi:ABC-type transporter Mla subunit MlaD